ncbi:hypothetical protein TSUD_21110 [Trifolium subterraneum]|uniref:RNase H type-1 domain-containing protein n=1 Tax=Trifolium subterraneum TaxID=3900 RepID=A0A2Z6MMA8_TRISU|nr:hypothetical protein TSUD_21110 [Trifolium subterraneum]
MAWYRSFPQGFVTSMKDLCKQFTSHFTASQKHLKTEANLEAVVQGPNETLRSYIERVNKEAVQVDVTDDMKKYLMRKNLCDGTKFKEMVTIEKPATWDEIMYKAQAYMQFEEETLADAMRYSRTEDNRPPREQDNRNEDKRNGDKRGRDKSREPRAPPSQFTNYTPLLESREIVLTECSSSDFKNAGIRFPKSTPYKPGQDRSRYCAYHKSYGNLTEDCIQLKDAIEILIRNDKLKDYVKKKDNPRQQKREDSPNEGTKPEPPRAKSVAYSVTRPEDFYFEELIPASSGMTVTPGKPKTSSQPLSFYLEELPGGSLNSQIPLLVRSDMANFDVRRILLNESHLTPYVGSDLQGFNGATTKPWGYVDLVVTFDYEETAKSIKVKFLVVDCSSLYQRIIGRTTIADLPVVASIAHLKMKYYTNKGHVATLHGDIEAARKCFEAAYKGQSYVGPAPSAKKPKTSFEQEEPSTEAPPQQPPQNVSMVDLDSRHSKQEHKEEKTLRKEKKEDDPASKENLRHIPDGDFKLIPLGEDPSRNLKIGKYVPDLARKQLVACLKDNANLFAWSATEIPGLDPEVACHQLTVDEAASAVVQRRRMHSPGKKKEAAEKAVKDLLKANFISEVKVQSNPNGCGRQGKNGLMTESGNYYYNVMPFGLKNVGATYQRMMNKVFRGEIGDMLEVFEQAKKVNMRFNPEKCTFGIRAGKFLGFYLTERGIEANPDKCRAFTEFPTPNDKKSIQTLNGMLTALSHFVAKSAQHALPLFKLLRKESAFEWTEECEQTLQHLKKTLFEPPVLSHPDEGEVLYLYLTVASEVVSATLIRETLEGQKPVYFTSKALQGPELRYQRIEKVVIALVNAARRLRHYLLAHTIVVRTDQPIKSLLVRPDMAGRMLKWSLELSEFDIRYESRKALKAQVLADFVAEMTCSSSSTNKANKWTIFVDGASNATGAGAGIILENEEGILIEVSLALSFPTSNNQAEYEAFLAGLRLAEDVGTKEIKIYTYSQLIASQVLGEYQVKNDNLSEYLALVKEKITKFDSVEIQHVSREHNKRADILSKLASTKRKNENKSIIQEILSELSIKKPSRILDINAIGDANCWMTPVYNYLAHGTLPNDEKEAATHIGGCSLARKAPRAGYYWPTMQQDVKEHVKKCDKCQRHADMHLAPPTSSSRYCPRGPSDGGALTSLVRSLEAIFNVSSSSSE